MADIAAPTLIDVLWLAAVVAATGVSLFFALVAAEVVRAQVRKRWPKPMTERQTEAMLARLEELRERLKAIGDEHTETEEPK